MLTRCLFWRGVTIHLSFSNFLCDWLSVDPDLSAAPYDQKDLCAFCRTYTSVESLTTKTVGPLKRQSSSTVASLHNITGSVASCYKSYRLQLVCDHYTMWFYYTTLMCRLKFFHHSVESPNNSRRPMSSSFSDDPLTQFTVKPFFCYASKHVRPLMGAIDLRWIYNNMLIPYATRLVHSHRPTM